MVEQQQQERSPGLATIAAFSLAGWLALYGLLAFNRCSGEMCGYALLGPVYLLFGMAALTGIAAWLGAMFRAVGQREVLSVLSIGLLLPVALFNVFNVLFVGGRAAGLLPFAGPWALFAVVSTTLLATSMTRRQAMRSLVAVAGLVLAVALLVASNLVV
jgi:hypothetical protein